MESMNNRCYILWLIIFGLSYFFGSVWLARRFPPLNVDEVIVAVNGDNYLSGNGIRYSLNDDVFAVEGDRLI